VAAVAIPMTVLASPLMATVADFSAGFAVRTVMETFVDVMRLLFICRIVMG